MGVFVRRIDVALGIGRSAVPHHRFEYAVGAVELALGAPESSHGEFRGGSDVGGGGKEGARIDFHGDAHFGEEVVVGDGGGDRGRAGRSGRRRGSERDARGGQEREGSRGRRNRGGEPESDEKEEGRRRSSGGGRR
eukprot:CAMPEP_0183303444 /NCGR_PEP_ID=MMETSP0160_2-20130417/8882_1 /TAXON_ID=2839 ORGANISM="Odontella Sinensis, Strain Grunow 1884" /NCGR_SAMPLE_ID=MMETSP0160_2 /ASSEMBLY_ACC=CAM_ASM_000250 /LENGTH=135 /DNA_ID=CAMNT_0025466351 /DNA_START=279 /DNA_END=682 /DNA_ORIENTATION=+